jgi:hypothetical protein
VPSRCPRLSGPELSTHWNAGVFGFGVGMAAQNTERLLPTRLSGEPYDAETLNQ